MRLPLWAFGLGFVGLAAGVVAAGQADEKGAAKFDLKLDPAKTVPGTCRMYVVSDKRYEPKDELNRTGKLHDPVGEHGLAPVLAIFSRTVPTKADAPVVTLMQEADRAATKYRPLRFGAFVAFLTLTKDFPDDGERDTRIAEVTNVARGANVTNVTVGVAEATVEDNGKAVPSPQVQSWKIGPDDDVVVVFYYRFEVIRRWSFTKDKPPSVEDIDAISTEVDKLLGSKLAAPRKKAK